MNVSKAQIDAVIDSIPENQKQEILDLMARIDRAEARDSCQESFMSFVKRMWPNFIEGRHHRIMAEAFEDIATGKLKRLIINMPPRHTKSEFASYLLPAWILGRSPDKKVIQASHTADLAVGFGRKVRNLVGSAEYNEIFPNTSLSADSTASGRWSTSAKGEYYAIGVGGAIAGRGADLYIIDDPHSEQDLQTGDPGTVFNRAYDWYTSGPRQRLQPNGAIVIVMTRWDQRDLTAKIVNQAAKAGSLDEWRIIEFPMEMPSGEPVWPEYWDKEHMEAIKRDLPKSAWLGQYQQKPTSEEGAIVKRDWWKVWPHEEPPSCDYVIQTWDTAYLKTQIADFSACTTWGVFKTTDPNDETRTVNNLILLDAWQGRVEFPELKRKAIKSYNQWTPDAFIVEAKATGPALIQELRAMGIPVSEHRVTRGTRNAPNDKRHRLSAISDIFESGLVWRPDTMYADDIVEQMASYPNSTNDDLMDTGIMAVERFRRGGFITLESDYEQETFRPRKAAYY